MIGLVRQPFLRLYAMHPRRTLEDRCKQRVIIMIDDDDEEEEEEEKDLDDEKNKKDKEDSRFSVVVPCCHTVSFILVVAFVVFTTV